VRGQNRAVGQVRLILRQQPLEPQDQGVLAAPLDGGLGAAGGNLRERVVERRTPGRALGKRAAGILALQQEGLL
jgi:hypothetical protein